MSSSELNENHRKELLDLARASITWGLNNSKSINVDCEDYDAELCQVRATFVTLKKKGELRGCIGTLNAYRSLAEDVAAHAYAAAFQDIRFTPVRESELEGLHISISILTPAVPMEFDAEEDLIAQLRPGIDGLILESGGKRGTFLPSVWESVPQREDFFKHLKRKAGLPLDYWSDDLKVSRYETVGFGE